ncbi:MAG: hypothetical protein Q9M34_05065, partial [Sulfurimonas sp.]|nr:hypothetical protein [Sulfurimonas sp.]
MKFFVWMGSFILVILMAIYTIAFTVFGNGIVAQKIESEIREATKLDAKLSTFTLSMSDFKIVLELSKSNKVTLIGNYSLFSQAFNIAYRVNFEAVEELKNLTNAPLVGRIFTEGKVKGNMAFIEVDGLSDIAKSDTTYHIELTNLDPTSIIAKVQKADLASLLRLGGQSAYASAEVNLDVNFKNITPHKLDGDILLKTINAKIDTALMKKDFNITLPKTSFVLNLGAKLHGDDIDYTYKLNSNLANITSGGKIIPQPLSIDINYGVDIQELAVLQPITGAALRGAFKTKGIVLGTKKSILVKGTSDIGGSDTTYKVALKEFQPQSVLATIKGAKLQKILYMLGQP